jgi:hypothetical protein
MPDKIGRFDLNEMDDGRLLVQNPCMSDKMVAAPDGDPLIINGAWYLDAYPSSIIIERADNSLGMINLTPFRAIKAQDIRDYKSYHPRKCKGSPLPDYLYRFYGLAKNTESATEVIHIRLTPTEKAKIETAAANEDKTTSEFVRDWVRSL